MPRERKDDLASFPEQPFERPYVVSWNLTYRCNLACEHCYLDAKVLRDGAPDELGTEELKDVISDIASVGPEAMIVLTGGEPLLRRDIEELAGHATALGLMVVVGTNGIPLTPERIERLKQSGVAGVGISVDSLDPDHHDAFRGRAGPAGSVDCEVFIDVWRLFSAGVPYSPGAIGQAHNRLACCVV